MTWMKSVVIAAAAALLLVPSTAGADWLFTPFVGGNFGGDSEQTQPNFGLSAAWMGSGIVGFEADLGFVPDFLEFGLEDPFTLIDESSVSTYMANVIFGVPVGGQGGMGFRPYASFGLGGVRTSASSSLGLIDGSSTDFGWNAGAGAMGFMSNMVGFRGDLRYFASTGGDIQDSPLTSEIDRFSFWRLTGGVVFRFGGM